MKPYIYILFLFMLFFVPELRAQKVLDEAHLAYKKKEFVKAIDLYKESLKVVKVKSARMEVFMHLGDCYKLLNDNKNAIKFYEQCYRARYNDPLLFLKMGEVLLKMGEYDDAIEFLNIYVERMPTDIRAKNLGESCLFAKKNQSVIPGVVLNNETNLNSSSAEYGLAVLNNSLIFSSSRRVKDADHIYKVTGQGYTSFFKSEATVENPMWSTPEFLEGIINTPYNEGTCSYDSKNKIFYFMVCNGLEGDRNNCAIYFSGYNEISMVWSEPQLLKMEGNQYSYGHPFIANQGKRLFFVSDMPGGKGLKDIWYMDKVNGEWQEPINAGNKINTAGDEQFPYFFGDSVFYFSSDGHPGYGALDIYKSHVIRGEFSNPDNLGIPLNSSYDDFGILLFSADSGLFCSNRPEGLGDDDIYSFYFKKNEFLLTGKVTDRQNQQPIGNALVIVGDKNMKFDSVRTNAGGVYAISGLKHSQEYVVTVYKNGYLGDLKYYHPGENLKTNKVNDSVAYLNVALLKFTDQEININHIYYDFGKWNLTPESKLELNKLVRLLKVNPGIKIRINSHTDAIGDEGFNMELSNYRAQSVVNYLVDNEIEAERLTFKGWGESNLVVKNPENDEEQRLNRRTSFQIVNLNEMDDEYSIANYKELTESIVVGHIQELDVISGSFNEDTRKEVVYRLQIYAGSVRISRTYLSQVEALIGRHKIVSTKGKDGYYRYAVGDFKKFDHAMEMKALLEENGCQSFVIAFMNDLRITILEARQLSGDN